MCKTPSCFRSPFNRYREFTFQMKSDFSRQVYVRRIVCPKRKLDSFRDIYSEFFIGYCSDTRHRVGTLVS